MLFSQGGAAGNIAELGPIGREVASEEFISFTNNLLSVQTRVE